MAEIFVEGFDQYGPGVIPGTFESTNNTLPQGGWTIDHSFGSPNIAAPLSSTGQSAQFQTGSVGYLTMSKTLPANYGRLIGGFRFSDNLLGVGGIVFIDNSTAQCSIMIEATSGFISIKQGNNGTLLQTSAASVAANTTHYLEFDITFNTGALGGWTVWLDGVEILAGTGTTQQSSNNYANVVQFYGGASNGGSVYTWDDMYLFDNTTAFNNAALLSNPFVITDFSINDQQTQFTNDGNVFGNTYSVVTTGSAIAANTITLAPFVPNVNCTINDIIVVPLNTSGVPNFQGVIYSDNAGAPDTLLSNGSQITGCTSGVPLILGLTTPQSLTAGTTYWLGFIMDSAINMLEVDGTHRAYVAANTYSSGAPSTAPAMTANQPTIVLYGACTGAATNWESEALNPPVGDFSAVSSVTPGTEDLYVFPALPANVTIVYSVSVSANCRLSAPGSHTFDLSILSNGSTGNGATTNIPPTTNYAWYSSCFATDPHTSVAWTPSDVSNAFCGMEMIS